MTPDENKSFSILHNNIRGFNSKRVSFESIINKIKPDVITLNEVGLKGKKKR